MRAWRTARHGQGDARYFVPVLINVSGSRLSCQQSGIVEIDRRRARIEQRLQRGAVFAAVERVGESQIKLIRRHRCTRQRERPLGSSIPRHQADELCTQGRREIQDHMIAATAVLRAAQLSVSRHDIAAGGQIAQDAVVAEFTGTENAEQLKRAAIFGTDTLVEILLPGGIQIDGLLALRVHSGAGSLSRRNLGKRIGVAIGRQEIAYLGALLVAAQAARGRNRTLIDEDR